MKKPSKAKKEARANRQPTYQGDPCKHCGNTERYVRDRNCTKRHMHPERKAHKKDYRAKLGTDARAAGLPKATKTEICFRCGKPCITRHNRRYRRHPEFPQWTVPEHISCPQRHK